MLKKLVIVRVVLETARRERSPKAVSDTITALFPASTDLLVWKPPISCVHKFENRASWFMW
jgi:hypothetical protein